MSLRLVEIFQQKGESEDLKFLLDYIPIYEFWADKLPDERLNVHLSSKDVDKVVDVFDSFFQDKERYRIVVLPVDAAIPREEEKKEERTSREKQPLRGKKAVKVRRGRTLSEDQPCGPIA